MSEKQRLASPTTPKEIGALEPWKAGDTYTHSIGFLIIIGELLASGSGRTAWMTIPLGRPVYAKRANITKFVGNIKHNGKDLLSAGTNFLSDCTVSTTVDNQAGCVTVQLASSTAFANGTNMYPLMINVSDLTIEFSD